MIFYLIPPQPETGRKDIVACHDCVRESTVRMIELEGFKLDDDDQPIKCAYCPNQGCVKCGGVEDVKDYNQGYTKEPLMLCADCTEREADRANERSQGDAWAGGFADNH